MNFFINKFKISRTSVRKELEYIIKQLIDQKSYSIIEFSLNEIYETELKQILEKPNSENLDK
ncbi:MAG: hypothetical protein C5T88_01345 [Williamsoniiplasma luminosum]|uniref:Uncharacterized protein n=1 Tax=Williamsoniiplasma luminosum TaxID=214888 RepID=A0A2S0NJM9_9MOLU|nr:MAG: hypothetical protein C5T88_01345 [Williamsoniiplasma luminosum]